MAPLEPPQKDFFVSYTKADKKWAEWIATQLEDAGYTCILQTWDFLPGGNFVLDMQKATIQTRRTIAVLSPDYLSALYPQAEWAAAFTQDPTSEDGKLLPVRVQKCTPSGILAAIGYIDLVGKDEQKAREALLKGVARRRGKPATSPAFPGASIFPGATASSTSTPFPKNPLASLPVETFIVYAREDQAYIEELERYLYPLEKAGQLHIWHQGKILVGDETQKETDRHFFKAKLFLLLVSSYFISSSDCSMLAEQAMKRHNLNDARVMPILLSACYWQGSSFGKLNPYPKSGKAINTMKRDLAYLDIIHGLQELLPEA
jgi:TIR domain-containing protein